MFQTNNYPLKVGRGAQHLQLRTSWTPYSSRGDSDNYPNDYIQSSRKKFSQIPRIKWNCPPKFALNHIWRIAAGEEGQEAEAQNYRETRVPEAVYLRLSDIPPSPSMSLDVEYYHPDDSCVPLIPLNPIEEEEPSKSGNLDTTPTDPPVSLKPPANGTPDIGTKPGLEGDVKVAAAAAYTAIMKSKERGSNIDTDLLIQLLNNPEIIQKLMNEHGLSVNAGSVPACVQKLVTSSAPMPSSNIDKGVKKSSDEQGLAVSAPVSEPLQVTLSFPFPCSKIDMKVRKSSDELTAPPDTGSVLIPGTPFVPLISKTNMDVGKSYGEIFASANTGYAPLSVPGPKMATKKLTDQLPRGFTTEPWSPSIPFSSSKANETVIGNLINELGRCINTGITQCAELKPAASSVSSHNSKSDASMIKRLINEYGDNTRNESMLGSKPISQSVPLSTPNSVGGELSPNTLYPDLQLRPLSSDLSHKAPFWATTAPPVKDINYYKSLIKQHGEGQENLNRDPSEVGKLHNHPQGSVQVKNMKSNEMKPMQQKRCIYFNSSKGCLNGSTCPYKHIEANGSSHGRALGAPRAKRMKLLGGGIARKT